MRILLPALVVVLLSIASCAQPKYLVKGLTLPAGATVTNEMESKQISMQIPMMGEVDKAITINFDCSSDWDAIVSHINQSMSKEGYEESFSQLNNMFPGGQSNPMQDQVMSSMRMWSKAGGKHQVMLMNNKAMLGAAGSGKGFNSESLGATGMGDYTLTVIRYKGDK
jgi:hypothetical protein